ncbi:hypothetical protein [Actibacterium pelagium]|nr:hypothetical protein [Actibacterium pelagium]
MTLAVSGATVSLDPYLGGVRDLRFEGRPGTILPLHGGENSVHYGNGFTCSALGDPKSETPDVNWHPDEIWQSEAEAIARLTLARRVRGALVEKEIRLRRDEPILYQTHRITGGEGRMSVGHHPLIQLGRSGRLSFSSKQVALTEATSMEQGLLQYPAYSTDLSRFPGRGSKVDLHEYPARTAREDIVTLVEAQGNELGWSAVVRGAEDDIIFVLKDPRVLPLTKLRYSCDGSNWGQLAQGSGGLLEIEDGCADGQDALTEASSCVAFKASVLPLAMNRQHVVRQAIGAIPRPEGWKSIADIRVCGNELQLMGSNGQSVRLPFDNCFFGLPSYPDILQ